MWFSYSDGLSARKTVSNLGSQWAFVIMLVGLTHFFGGQIQKRSKFSNLEIFDLGTPCIGNAESKRP